MKIYFGFTMRGDRQKLNDVKELVEILKKKGHTILTTHVFDENFERNESAFTDEYIFERDMEWISEADAVIMEASGSSFGIGFEAGFALCSGKKVYILYDKSLAGKISKMATGNTMKNCVRVPYKNFGEAEKFVEENF